MGNYLVLVENWCEVYSLFGKSVQFIQKTVQFIQKSVQFLQKTIQFLQINPKTAFY